MLNIPQNQTTRRAAFLFQDEDDVFDTGGGQDRSLTTDFLLRTAGGQEVFAGDDLSAGLFFEFETGAFGDAAAFLSGGGVFDHSGCVVGLGDLAGRQQRQDSWLVRLRGS